MMLTWEWGSLCMQTQLVFSRSPGSAPKHFLSFLGSEFASPAGGTGAVAHRGCVALGCTVDGHRAPWWLQVTDTSSL